MNALHNLMMETIDDINSGIYFHYEKENDGDIYYVGQTDDLDERLNAHRYVTKRIRQKQKTPDNATDVDKYNAMIGGKDMENVVEKVIRCLLGHADYWEQYYIKLLNTYGSDFGKNMMRGGTGFPERNIPPPDRVYFPDSICIINNTYRLKNPMYDNIIDGKYNLDYISEQELHEVDPGYYLYQLNNHIKAFTVEEYGDLTNAYKNLIRYMIVHEVPIIIPEN
jgi:hypothetical protein